MWRCNALMAEREQTRTLSRAKVQKIFQKTAFWEDINTIPTLKCAFCQEKLYIEDGNGSLNAQGDSPEVNPKVWTD